MKSTDETLVGTPGSDTATRTSSMFSVILAVVTVAVALSNHMLGLVLGLVAILFIAIAVLEARRSWLSGGVLLLIAGTTLAALEAGVTLASFVGLALVFVVWDCGEYAIELGNQIGRRGPTQRQEIRNAATSLAVAAVGVGVGWLVITNVSAGVPLVATVPLAVGLLFLIVALRS